MSFTEVLKVVTPETTVSPSSQGKFARLRKSEKPLTSGNGSTESALGNALSALAARSGNQESQIRGVRFHLTRNEPCVAECDPVHRAHQKLLVRLYWRGAGSEPATGLREWALENSKIRGRLESFSRDEIQMKLQVEVPCGSLLEVRVIDACSNETDLRGKVMECRGGNGEWSVSCRLFSALSAHQILELCGR